jgi:hypothetical protein
MSKTTHDEKAAALERWADDVEPDDLVAVDTSVLRQLAKLADQRAELDNAVTEAVRAARRAHRSWSEIGAMLGVSKQAVQRKYNRRVRSA